MCGIAGYIGTKQIEKYKIRNTLKLMINRGPDNQNWHKVVKENFNIFLLHSRLSIIDLDNRSNQPFIYEKYIIVFNGEIYNFVEIRKKLLRLGYQFSTNSDTEVLLMAYIEYGENCVNYFNGMWSFAIWDGIKENLFLSRDRFGEKPLYYLKNSSGIYFGSEVKFIQALISKKLLLNYRYLNRYLIYGYKYLHKNSETFFEGLSRLDSSTNMIISKDNQKKYKYWEPKIEQNLNMSYGDALEGTKQYLFESIKLRLRSDVPLAFCLSGGVDSSSLVSIARKYFNHEVVTFSIIDNDKRYNELDNITETIKKLDCKHYLIELDYNQILSKLENLVTYHDAPISTISYLIHSLLSEKIKEKGFKVSISGTSADELFTGYYDHFNLHLYEMRNFESFNSHLKYWEDFISPSIRNPFLKDPFLYIKNPLFRKHNHLNSEVFSSFLYKNFEIDIIDEVYTKSLLRNRMLNELLHEATPVLLNEDDLNSMMNSIENRSPFLDVNLVEFAQSIPTHHLIKKGFSKYILRDSVKNILNDKVRLDRRKKGFNASIKSLINFDDKASFDYFLSDSPIFEIIRKDKIEFLLKKHSLKNSYNKFLFNFLNSKIFIEKFS
ncbi:MAG: asparagine synthase (glutamine-hydrolyzing) [bacterium TMED264]|nr:MAG: asparagine synthase (glutamine-hydrolyzing) [bacterium TMED264]